MKVAITLNDTVREHYNIAINLMERYNDYFHQQQAHEINDNGGQMTENLARKGEILDVKVDNYRFSKINKFFDEEDYNSFFYGEAAFFLFSPKSPLYKEAPYDLNKLYGEIAKDHSCTVLSQERMNSKIATLNWLSINKILVNNYKFVYDYSKVWQMYDVIITANPFILKKKNLKNENKLSIKINTEYNRSVDADHSFDNIGEVLKMF